MMRRFAMDNSLDVGVVRSKVAGKGASKKRKSEDDGDAVGKKMIKAGSDD